MQNVMISSRSTSKGRAMPFMSLCETAIANLLKSGSHPFLDWTTHQTSDPSVEDHRSSPQRAFEHHDPD